MQAGDVGTLLTYDVEGGEDGSACCLRLNGTAGDLWVGIGPSLCEVCALGERVVVAAESLRAELARPSSHDDILYGGPFEGRPRAEVSTAPGSFLLREPYFPFTIWLTSSGVI